MYMHVFVTYYTILVCTFLPKYKLVLKYSAYQTLSPSTKYTIYKYRFFKLYLITC